MKAKLTTEAPNGELYKFEDTYLKISNNDKLTDTVGLDADNLILRGSSIAVNNNVIGAVVYTGSETKIQMNNL
jgi:magnesium-transporting ATPase (P-type)